MAKTTKDKTKKATEFASEKMPFSDEQLKEYFKKMLLIRRFEEKTGQQYQMKKFSGFCHLYIGQEAVVVGTAAALQMGKDYVFTTYRDHAHALVYGLPPNEVMAEFFMKDAGTSKGKGGSMHLFNGKMHFMGGNGIVGGHTPLATGVAFASKYRKEGAVVLCFMGDAAMNQGTFHESLNMAGLWKLPIVYIVENNAYGMGTAVNRSCAEPDLYKRTEGPYRIPGIRVNGMDLFEVYAKTKQAIDLARRESQPVFLEMQCYRFRGHSMSDPATTYRTKAEVSEWQTKDPIDRLKHEFPEIVTPEFVKEVEADVKEQIAEAIRFAESADRPDLSEIWTHVYKDCPGYPKGDVSPNKYAYPYEDYS